MAREPRTAASLRGKSVQFRKPSPLYSATRRLRGKIWIAEFLPGCARETVGEVPLVCPPNCTMRQWSVRIPCEGRRLIREDIVKKELMCRRWRANLGPARN